MKHQLKEFKMKHQLIVLSCVFAVVSTPLMAQMSQVEPLIGSSTCSAMLAHQVLAPQSSEVAVYRRGTSVENCSAESAPVPSLETCPNTNHPVDAAQNTELSIYIGESSSVGTCSSTSSHEISSQLASIMESFSTLKECVDHSYEYEYASNGLKFLQSKLDGMNAQYDQADLDPAILSKMNNLQQTLTKYHELNNQNIKSYEEQMNAVRQEQEADEALKAALKKQAEVAEEARQQRDETFEAKLKTYGTGINISIHECLETLADDEKTIKERNESLHVLYSQYVELVNLIDSHQDLFNKQYLADKSLMSTLAIIRSGRDNFTKALLSSESILAKGLEEAALKNVLDSIATHPHEAIKPTGAMEKSTVLGIAGPAPVSVQATESSRLNVQADETVVRAKKSSAAATGTKHETALLRHLTRAVTIQDCNLLLAKAINKFKTMTNDFLSVANEICSSKISLVSLDDIFGSDDA